MSRDKIAPKVRTALSVVSIILILWGAKEFFNQGEFLEPLADFITLTGLGIFIGVSVNTPKLTSKEALSTILMVFVAYVALFLAIALS